MPQCKMALPQEAADGPGASAHKLLMLKGTS